MPEAAKKADPEGDHAGTTGEEPEGGQDAEPGEDAPEEIHEEEE